MVLYGKRVFKNSIYLFLIICFLSSCCCWGKQAIGDGAGNFVFEYKIAGQVKKILVYYFCPKEIKPLSRIVFIMHGAGRNGKVYRDEWQKYAMRYNFIVLCPEFSEADFPSAKYNCGNIYDYDKKKYSEKADWTFNIIEGLFDFVKQEKELKAEAYCILGHSAGAQFVHRMVIFMPEARFSLAISNGAGDYTAPVFDKVFHGGLMGTGATEESLKKSFAKDMIVMMGAKDLMSKIMPKEGQFHEYDRVWRAKIFFKTAKTEAEKLQAIFKWRFMLVPDADHNNPVYAEIGSRFAANSRIFFSKSNAKEPNDINDVNGVGPTDNNTPRAK
jgi:poly(3-hydroxybutyrate) depolymerase